MSVRRSRAPAGRPLSVAVAGVAISGLAAAGAARGAYSALKRRPPGGEKAWSRTNHRGEAVTLLEGPAAAAGAIAGVLALASLRSLAGSGPGPGRAAWRVAAAMTVAGAGAAAFGAYDDLAGSTGRRGFGGHLGALRHGEVSTGAVKLGGIGTVGLASAALTGGDAADVAINAGLVAGLANLLNLFDLRPGRAIKAAVASSALIVLGGTGTAGSGATEALVPPLAAALAVLPEDLGERAMLGDTGANAVGAMLGAAACGLPRPARVALLAGIAALTAASEKVSFTAVIARTPVLHRLDMLGRRPASPARAIMIPAQRQGTIGPAGDTHTGRPAEDTDTAPPQE